MKKSEMTVKKVLNEYKHGVEGDIICEIEENKKLAELVSCVTDNMTLSRSAKIFLRAQKVYVEELMSIGFERDPSLYGPHKWLEVFEMIELYDTKPKPVLAVKYTGTVESCKDVEELFAGALSEPIKKMMIS